MSSELPTDQRLGGLRNRALEAKRGVEAGEQEIYDTLGGYILEDDRNNVNGSRSVTQVEGIYEAVHQNNGSSGEWIEIKLCEVPYSTKGKGIKPEERTGGRKDDCIVHMGKNDKGDFSDVRYARLEEEEVDGKIQLVQKVVTIAEFEARFQELIGKQEQRATQLKQEADILRIKPMSAPVVQTSDVHSQPIESISRPASPGNVSALNSA